MKFMRRPDIDNVARLKIAVQAFLGLGIYGEITRIAESYRVSRLFVYKLLWQLRLFYELEVRDSLSSEATRKEVDKHILLLRFEGHCALEGISQILKQLGLPFTSVGYISQRRPGLCTGSAERGIDRGQDRLPAMRRNLHPGATDSNHGGAALTGNSEDRVG